jgi:pentatricopeptide repeat protein
MSIDMSEWSESKKTKYSLLRRAFDQNRGAEVILLLQWRMALERHKNAVGAAIAREFEQENAGQPRALRALNLHMKNMGLNTIYKDTVPDEALEGVSNKAEVYIKPGFLERVLEGVDENHAASTAAEAEAEYSDLSNILNDFTQDNIILRSVALQERFDEAVEYFKEMPVKSNDMAYRVEDVSALKTAVPEYDDNEDAMDADEFVETSLQKFMTRLSEPALN